MGKSQAGLLRADVFKFPVSAGMITPHSNPFVHRQSPSRAGIRKCNGKPSTRICLYNENGTGLYCDDTPNGQLRYCHSTYISNVYVKLYNATFKRYCTDDSRTTNTTYDAYARNVDPNPGFTSAARTFSPASANQEIGLPL